MLNHELEIFVQVAQSGSFTNAASELFVTPASVMKQINQLENQLNLKLVMRSHQGIQLTSAGESFYEDALKIIAYTDKAIANAQQISGLNIATIKIGTSLLNPCQPLINLWNELSSNTDNIQIQIIPFEDTSQHILSFLSSLGKEVDLFFGPCGSYEWKKRANFLEIGNYAHCIAMPRNHPLSKKSILSVDDLRGQTILVGKQGDVPELESVRSFLKKHNVTIIDVNPNYDATVFNRCEQLNCLLLTLESWKEIHPSLITLPVTWDFKIPYGIMYSKNPSPAVIEFLTYFSVT